MIRTGTLQQSLANRRPLRLANGTGYFKSDFILPQGQDAGPQAFLIEQEPRSVIRPHFHRENQFQVVVAGGGELGRHPVAPVSLHYASRHTGYGPITAGEQGVSYFSLRDRFTAEAYYLPESRELMEDLPRRNVFAEPVAIRDDAALRSLRQPEVVPVIAGQTDGVAAWVVAVPPQGTVQVPAQGADRFHLVLAGELAHDSSTLPRLATLFTSAAEAPLALCAGSAGLQALVMQFPVASAGVSQPG